VNPDTPHGDGLDPAAAALAALFDAHRTLSDAIDREIRAACGLSHAEVDVLATLTRGPAGRQRMVDIAGQVCLSKSGVTQIVDRLEAAGLAARESCATDRRLVYAAITTAGRDVIDKATPVLAGIAHEHIASRLPDADLGKLTKTLRTIAGTSSPEASQR
jgi:DNA-binding MarR family transcriptional regulator